MKQIKAWLQWAENYAAIKLYALCLFIDRARNKEERFGYETAPYCGHYYNGHNGWLTSSNYHEGMGGKQVRCFIFNIDIYTEDSEYDLTLFPRIQDGIRSFWCNALYSFFKWIDTRTAAECVATTKNNELVLYTRLGNFTSEYTYKKTSCRKLKLWGLLWMIADDKRDKTYWRTRWLPSKKFTL